MTIRSTRDGAVTTIVIDRPAARNAVDGPTAEALAAAMHSFEADPAASVAVLAGSGSMFCAGADLKAFGGALTERANPLNDDMSATAPMGPSRLLLSKPVIAAVEGYAVAGGMELALWCDLRVVGRSAVFGIFCRRWGVPLIDGGTVRLPRLIGMSRALDLVLTGRPVDAQEALAIGLANRVVPDGSALAAAQALAAEIALFPQVCLRNDRASVFEQDGLTLEAALANEFRRGRNTLASGEATSGAARFTQGAGRGGRFGG
jgi:enoyl-CoA hydratase